MKLTYFKLQVSAVMTSLCTLHGKVFSRRKMTYRQETILILEILQISGLIEPLTSSKSLLVFIIFARAILNCSKFAHDYLKYPQLIGSLYQVCPSSNHYLNPLLALSTHCLILLRSLRVPHHQHAWRARFGFSWTTRFISWSHPSALGTPRHLTNSLAMVFGLRPPTLILYFFWYLYCNRSLSHL